MTHRPLLKSGSAIALALLTAGATTVHARSPDSSEAAADARDAARAMAKGKRDAAVRYAEHAVLLRPQDASYRVLLGKAYLGAGRFFSARQAFADALQLDAGQPGAALNLALATTATGDPAAAHDVLKANVGAIGAADLGLAFALAGDPAAAVEILLPAARGTASDAKTRQNLALAYALAGRWRDAHQVALVDLSPTDADARIQQWAAFAQPAAASDQVASLLGVTPVADGGLPVQLALASKPVQTATAPVEPAPDALVALKVAASPTPVAPTVAAGESPATPTVRIVFTAPREVVQALPPARTTAAVAPRTFRVRPAAAPTAPISVANGAFHVQLGAFDSPAMAKWGWDRARALHAALAGRTPYTNTSGTGLTRLTVGGFARGDADRMCRSIRSKGSACFVRASAGDRVASWVNGSVKVAARGGQPTRLAAR